ncbi:flavin-containing monooxygenase [Anaeromyxobacter dehalogenans]|uniref:Putative flavoprotein n=1 Tax=Anaeromyxobacter dehalogenans (strain 2CP-C) TaxID=290397 RepID=Q2IK48_ANADE|nr:NAD(P)/FAD-dependent oxidoreductase [Anaeromyxobacter dehalogenans]ABC82025.1 putative flavoprotein [Anaeromyxobacter dehalogenans 2CP-C]
MRRTDVVVIGGGQAGLAMSRCLDVRGIAHVVLERGAVGERWRSERWDSLRLLTPRWQSRLPGIAYRGPDPDGFMSRREVVGLLQAYARSFSAPVEAGVEVTALEPDGDGFRVEAPGRRWRARAVVIATGHCDRPAVPALAAALPPSVTQVVPSAYRSPDRLPPGGVLVVGASATGVQLADEIHRTGRPVTLAVGRHVRLPRRYRGRDVMWWLDRTGFLAEGADAVPDLEAARRQPSLQLVGRPDHRSLDLGVLAAAGVRLAGRLAGVEGGRVLLADDLAASVEAAKRRMERLLRRIDAHAARTGEPAPAPRPIPAPVAPPAPRTLDLRAEGIRTVLWATGYRRSYPWLRLPVLDARGELLHDGGVTPVPGLYVLGLQFLRRRNSSFLDGVGADAEHLAAHLARHLAHGVAGRAAGATAA